MVAPCTAYRRRLQSSGKSPSKALCLSDLALLIIGVALLPTDSWASGFGRRGGDDSSTGSSHQAPASSRSRPTDSPSSADGPSGYGRSRAQGGYGSRDGQRRSRPYQHYRYSDYYLLMNPYDRWRYDYYHGSFGFFPWGYFAYGYTPYWGAPAPHPELARRQPSSTTVAVFLGGMLSTSAARMGEANTGGVGGELWVDGQHLGFNLRANVFGLPDPDGPSLDAMPVMSAHVTVSALSSASMRLRLEVGFSGVHAPDYNYYGPDVGISGQFALFGPVGIAFVGRYTPFPATVVDAEAGLALQFGTLGVRGGWRVLRLDDRRVNPWGGGEITFSGPSFNIGAVF